MLTGLAALITGGSRGIGLATARVLRDAGARVLIVGRDEARLRESGLDFVTADVTLEAEVERMVGMARQKFGAVPNIAVHSAGAFHLSPIAETTVASFDRQIAVNLRAAFLLTRAVLPAMLERGSGQIVHIGSIAGRRAFPANGAYSASKYGLRGLVEVLDAELRGTGVRTTLVEPSATDTELWDTIDRAAFPDLPARTAMLSAEAVAQAVLYAVSQPNDVAVPNLSVERS